jgi:Mn2+/Fe2+ NRAMP family transporter
MSDQSKVESTRQLLVDAQEKGFGSTLGAYFKLSGPGWLQSAITLGGGSLAGALFLGVLGGYSLLWLQLLAITMGVIMLSAISYVTLSTGERPFRAINLHINPVLGWGWLIATCTANMIWCMPQFSLCFASLQKNLVGAGIGDTTPNKLSVSLNILFAATFVVLLSSRGGRAAKVFDWFLKALVGMIVICFFGVVVYLGTKGLLDWKSIFSGFIPDFRQATQPTGDVAGMIAKLPENLQAFWSNKVVVSQRDVMIGAAATAVGINMTFLLPYSMLNRGWDKPFRGLARFDLCTGMAIPYVLVTTCVVIAAAQSFHGKVDDKFLSSNPKVMQESALFGSAKGDLLDRVRLDKKDESAAVLPSSDEEKQAAFDAWKVVSPDAKDSTAKSFSDLTDDQKKVAAAAPAELAAIAALPDDEKRLAGSVVKRDAFQLSMALAPLFGEGEKGERIAKNVFGLGIFGMGFSTIIILMLINGYAFCEMMGKPQGGATHVVGCLVAGIAGICWPFIWQGDSKVWLAILVSSFGMMLLPIAYFTFFMMMNSKQLMRDQKPTGIRMGIWNVLMGVSVIGASIAAGWSIYKEAKKPDSGMVVIGIACVYIVLVVIGFIFKFRSKGDTEETGDGDEKTATAEA